jgi:hypothetical protein
MSYNFPFPRGAFPAPSLMDRMPLERTAFQNALPHMLRGGPDPIGNSDVHNRMLRPPLFGMQPEILRPHPVFGSFRPFLPTGFHPLPPHFHWPTTAREPVTERHRLPGSQPQRSDPVQPPPVQRPKDNVRTQPEQPTRPEPAREPAVQPPPVQRPEDIVRTQPEQPIKPDLQQRPPTEQEIANLAFMRELARSSSATGADRAKLMTIYEEFRLDDKTLARLSEIANDVANLVFTPANNWVAEASRDWAQFSTAERKEAITKFFDIMKDHLDLDVGLEFFSTPFEPGKTPRGSFSPYTNTIMMNMAENPNSSFMQVMQTMVHEFIHADLYNDTKDLSPDRVLQDVAQGRLGVTDAMLYFNLKSNSLYFGAADEGSRRYMFNPHEQAAFSGQMLFHNQTIARGYDSQWQFDSNHPVMRHLAGSGNA